MKVYISCNGIGLGHTGKMLRVATELRNKGHEVVMATWGEGCEFIKKERFRYYRLSNIQWCDNQDGTLNWFHTFLKLPWIAIQIGMMLVKEMYVIHKENPDIIVSDCNLIHLIAELTGRQTVYTTHQIKLPFKNKIIRFIATKINEAITRVCAKTVICDFKGPFNIYPYSNIYNHHDLDDVHYVGPIVAKPTAKTTQTFPLDNTKKLCTIIISGPGNSCTSMAKLIYKLEPELVKLDKWQFIIRTPISRDNKDNIQYTSWIYNPINIFEKSDLIISRAGYTTVCDILSLGKKCILVPQPNQVEQESIVRYLEKLKLANYLTQDELWLLPKLITKNKYDCIDDKDLKYTADRIQKCNAINKFVVVLEKLNEDRI